MYKKIAIITARSGSKGLPDKNILMLGNKEVIGYTIEAAFNSNIFDRVIVSTDSLEYKEISEQYGAEVILRKENLALDTTTSYEVIKDILENLKEKYDYFVLLQPTSPFRNEFHIREAVEKYEKNIDKYKYLVSMVKNEKNKDLIASIDDDESLKNFEMDFSNYRRQNYKEYYPNGAIFIGNSDDYLIKKHFFGKDSLAYIMEEEDSIDIDTPLDFEMALAIYLKKNKKILLTESIKNHILEKKKYYQNFKINGDEILFVGHSILDQMGENINLNGKKVINWGISGINSKEYNKYILDNNLIKFVGNKVVLMFGTNDIIIRNWKKEVLLEEINKIIKKLKKINENTIFYFIEITKVRNRMDRNNRIIEELNDYLKYNLKEKVRWIEINSKIEDKYGKLRKDLTEDGLHFNDFGKNILLEEIQKNLK